MSETPPSTPSSDRDAQKRAAGEAAADWVEPAMVVGLGTGSTAIWAIRRIGARITDGSLRDVMGIPTSVASEHAARAMGIPLTTLDEHPTVDVTIDGADEIDPHLRLIKGGGGALLREKVVAQASRREVIVVDDAKLSPVLGTHHPLPVEIVPFSLGTERRYLDSLGASTVLRTDGGTTFVTDSGHWILDCDFGPIDEPAHLAALLATRAGVMEHGLFLGLTTDVLVAGPDGVEHLTP